MRHFTFRIGVGALVAALALVPRVAAADVITIDFESLKDGEQVVKQFLPDLVFSNAMALTAGISLNEVDFPPHSGTNVVFDDGGAMRVDFNPLRRASLFAGFFTYAAPLTLEAFNDAGKLLGSVSSLFKENLGSGEHRPNEFLQLTFSDMSYVVITGDTKGSSFVLDDLSYELGKEVPEPGTLALMLVGAAAMLRTRRRVQKRRA